MLINLPAVILGNIQEYEFDDLCYFYVELIENRMLE